MRSVCACLHTLGGMCNLCMGMHMCNLRMGMCNLRMCMGMSMCNLRMAVCVYVCMYVCRPATHVVAPHGMDVCMHVCMYVCMYVCRPCLLLMSSLVVSPCRTPPEPESTHIPQG